MSALDKFYLTESQYIAYKRWVEKAKYLSEYERNEVSEGIELSNGKPLAPEYYCIIKTNRSKDKVLAKQCPFGFIQKQLERMYNTSIDQLKELI